MLVAQVEKLTILTAWVGLLLVVKAIFVIGGNMAFDDGLMTFLRKFFVGEHIRAGGEPSNHHINEHEYK